MIKIGGQLITEKRFSLLERLLYRLRVRKGGIFLIATPEKNGRSFLMRYLEKHLSVHEMVLTATETSNNLLIWIGKQFRLSSPSLEDIEREFKPIILSGKHIVILIERTRFFKEGFLNDLNVLLEKIPQIKVVITGTYKELKPLKKEPLYQKILSQEKWPSFSFTESLRFLEVFYSNLPLRSRFLIAFTGHGRAGILTTLAEKVSIFKTQVLRRTIQVILKNYNLTYPFFPKNLGIGTGIITIGLIGYFVIHPIILKQKQHRIQNALEYLETIRTPDKKEKGIIVEEVEEPGKEVENTN
ncbi:MAG: hypothetical protein JXR30_03320 [Alphaproteobacteria bacterium]|nr:hypothetical protein [Alphaproteobacteria bacterium]